MSTPKSRKRASTKSERKVAADLGGRRVFASGSGLDKADGRVPGKYRIENKYTESEKYALSVKDWMILWRTAIESNEEPIFHIKMRDPLTGGFAEVVIVELNWYSTRAPVFALPHPEEPAKSHTIRASNVASRPDGFPYLFRLDGKLARRPDPKTWWLIATTYAHFRTLVKEI